MPQTPSTSQPQSQPTQQRSPTSQSRATPTVSPTEQQWQARLNDMDQAFMDSIATLTSIQTQLTTFKSGITSQSYPTWNQMESLSQQVSRAVGQLHAARQALPIGVAT